MKQRTYEGRMDAAISQGAKFFNANFWGIFIDSVASYQLNFWSPFYVNTSIFYCARGEAHNIEKTKLLYSTMKYLIKWNAFQKITYIESRSAAADFKLRYFLPSMQYIF